MKNTDVFVSKAPCQRELHWWEFDIRWMKDKKPKMATKTTTSSPLSPVAAGALQEPAP